MRSQRRWVDGDGPGRWRLAQRAVLDAWGDAGVAVRAVLAAPQLAAFLSALLHASRGVGAGYGAGDDGARLRRPAG